MAYTYLAADLMTNAILAELPLNSVSFESKLSAAGSFSGRLSLGDARVTAIDPFGSTQPGRTALYVDSGGRLVWGGIIWTRRYDSDSAQMDIGAQEFWSYFDHRLNHAVASYRGVDQLTLATTVINAALGVTGGNPGSVGTPAQGFRFGGAASSGVLADLDLDNRDLKVVSSIVSTLASTQQGFDFAVDVAYDANGRPAKTITLSYPRRGAPALTTGLLFDLPGNITHYAWPEDASKAASSVHVLGTGYGGVGLYSPLTDTSVTDAGYPLLETAISYKDVTTQSVLDRYAQTQLATLRNPLVLPVLDVDPTQDPVLGGYTVGDECRVRITDQRFAAGVLDTYFRIVGIKVTPQEASHEMVTLTLSNPFTG